jgi:glycosyltransferase involved in cell wall biosynthesis
MPAGFGAEVMVVPYPVACLPPRQAGVGRSALGLPEDAVITLAAFNLASSFERKNPLAAIAAHRLAFGARMDRMLLMRVGSPEHFPADLERLRAAAVDMPNVRFDTRTLPRDDAHAVMAACDIVLSLHRSEGFGLVPAEAMLLEKPVVATDWSGTADFIDATCGIPVPARLVPAVDPRGVFQAPGAVWADPDVAAAAAGLQRLADDPGLRRRMGRAARAAAMARLGPAALGSAVRGLGLAVP